MKRLLSVLFVALFVCTVSQARADDKRAILSVTFDDTLRSQYTNAFPVLQKYGIRGTMCLVMWSDILDEVRPGEEPIFWARMSWSQIRELQAAGWETCAHSVTHADLTKVTDDKLSEEVLVPLLLIQKKTGILPSVFASPDGLSNVHTMELIQALYRSHLSVWWEEIKTPGFNDPATFDPYRIARLGVTRDEPSEERVCAFIEQAVKEKAWYVLVFHNVQPETKPIPQDENAVSIEKFEAIMLCAARARDAGVGGLRIATISEALRTIAAEYPNSPTAKAARPTKVKK